MLRVRADGSLQARHGSCTLSMLVATSTAASTQVISGSQKYLTRKLERHQKTLVRAWRGRATGGGGAGQ